jgi:hypothetical protein
MGGRLWLGVGARQAGASSRPEAGAGADPGAAQRRRLISIRLNSAT